MRRRTRKEKAERHADGLWEAAAAAGRMEKDAS